MSQIDDSVSGFKISRGEIDGIFIYINITRRECSWVKHNSSIITTIDNINVNNCFWFDFDINSVRDLETVSNCSRNCDDITVNFNLKLFMKLVVKPGVSPVPIFVNDNSRNSRVNTNNRPS